MNFSMFTAFWHTPTSTRLIFPSSQKSWRIQAGILQLNFPELSSEHWRFFKEKKILIKQICQLYIVIHLVIKLGKKRLHIVQPT